MEMSGEFNALATLPPAVLEGGRAWEIYAAVEINVECVSEI